MRQVDQRVSVRVELTGLDRPGVGEYIAHRLNVAGGGTDRVTFSDDAVDAVFKATKGNPRLINLSCDKALHHGHLARTFTIGPELVTRALAELGMTDPVQSAAAPAPASARAAAPPEPTDDFGLGEKFFERERPRPVGDDDIPPVVETTAPQFLLGGTSDETPPSSKRRTMLLLFLCILAPVLVAWLIWTWQQQPSEGSALPSLPIPANEDAAVMAKPVGTEAAPVGQSPTPTTGQIVPADAGSQPYEVGVALFAGYDRANRLAVALAASGFRAITRPIESSRGRMYEVRTGPYVSREEAEADAILIRQLPGYADARVVAPSAVPPPASRSSPLYSVGVNHTEQLKALDTARWRIAIALTAAMMVLYFGFILLVAYAKPLLGSLVVPGLSLGILLGALVIVAAWVLIWIYVRWANTHYDAAIDALRGRP